MIGDNVETDGRGALRTGMSFVHVDDWVARQASPVSLPSTTTAGGFRIRGFAGSRGSSRRSSVALAVQGSPRTLPSLSRRNAGWQPRTIPSFLACSATACGLRSASSSI